jgi:type VI secretion system protein ImpM
VNPDLVNPDLVTGARAAIGFFGKLPARGDFVRRDLPQDFVDAWDGWLAAGIAESRALLGEDWLPAFLEAPVWHFALAPGVAGPGMAGVLLPSVDRAGRYFPLTLAAPAAQAPLLFAHLGWFESLAAAGIAALSEDATLGAFEAALAALPPPPEPVRPEPFAGGLGAADATTLLGASSAVLLRTAGGARVSPRIAAMPMLPAPGAFADLLRDPPTVTASAFAVPRFNAALFGDDGP